MTTIRRVAVLGAGTMGSRIAAHFANAGIPSLLLDIVLPDEADRNAAARKGLASARKQKPVAFFTGSGVDLVTIGNFDDDLEGVRDCDWVIEAITEDLDIKRQLWEKVEPLVKPEAILSTNTSGIPLARISDGFSPGFCRQFLGTHFFNPPRYLHLAEIIPGADTAPEVLDFVSDFCDRRLGKGVVGCKDTPNFIGNRIGSFFFSTIYKITAEDDYTVEEVDALTGPLIGLPKSATYRLADVVGLDIWAFVGKNLYDLVPDDPWRDRFLPPPFLNEMIERGWFGQKSGQGFYRRVGKGADRVIEAIDWKTLDYHPRDKPKLPNIDAAKSMEDLAARLRYLVKSDDRVGSFLWKLFSDWLLYSAERIPEISDRVVEIDRAMKWGYAFELGPFEFWDALGFEETARRMEKDGRDLPPGVTQMLSDGAGSFYRHADEDGRPHTEYFDLTGQAYEQAEDRPGVLTLADIKRARGVVKENAGASLIDLGDGVLCVEFHSKMNSLGEDARRIINSGIEETERNYEAMVIANQGPAFSAGANLMTLLLAAQEGDWDEIDHFIRAFQQSNMDIRCASRPVMAAPFGHTLGGGCEVALHAARLQASAELYIGLVELGVGLIPAGGGVKQMLVKGTDPDQAFQLIGFAKVSTSAAEARTLGFLADADGISMNPERLVADAKRLALSLAPTYSPQQPRTDVEIGGEAVYARLKLAAWTARQAEQISDYDLVLADKLAYVLAGGRTTGRQTVCEQYLLDLEREAFLSLCGNKKTQERIQHMLKTGKPLRN